MNQAHSTLGKLGRRHHNNPLAPPRSCGQHRVVFVQRSRRFPSGRFLREPSSSRGDVDHGQRPGCHPNDVFPSFSRQKVAKFCKFSDEKGFLPIQRGPQVGAHRTSSRAIPAWFDGRNPFLLSPGVVCVKVRCSVLPLLIFRLSKKCPEHKEHQFWPNAVGQTRFGQMPAQQGEQVRAQKVKMRTSPLSRPMFSLFSSLLGGLVPVQGRLCVWASLGSFCVSRDLQKFEFQTQQRQRRVLGAWRCSHDPATEKTVWRGHVQRSLECNFGAFVISVSEHTSFWVDKCRFDCNS